MNLKMLYLNLCFHLIFTIKKIFSGQCTSVNLTPYIYICMDPFISARVFKFASESFHTFAFALKCDHLYLNPSLAFRDACVCARSCVRAHARTNVACGHAWLSAYACVRLVGDVLCTLKADEEEVSYKECCRKGLENVRLRLS